MADRYRIMVIGEDNVEFCFDDHLTKKEAYDFVDACKEQYPCARLYVEKMNEDQEFGDSWY